MTHLPRAQPTLFVVKLLYPDSIAPKQAALPATKSHLDCTHTKIRGPAREHSGPQGIQDLMYDAFLRSDLRYVLCTTAHSRPRRLLCQMHTTPVSLEIALLDVQHNLAFSRRQLR